MADYESEHSIPQSSSAPAASSRRRPDLSTFFANLEHVDTSNSNTSTIPNPTYVTAAYRQLANAYQIMLGEAVGAPISNNASIHDTQHPAAAYASDTIENPLLMEMATLLQRAANDPPKTIESVPESFFDELERVDKKELVRLKDAACPVCQVPFLEDKYPLVVRLPCHRSHLFDMECIRPWLSLNVTCPIDRKRLVPEEKEPAHKRRDARNVAAAAQDDEDEDDVDGMYG